MKCARCDHVGPIGGTIFMHRDGMVPGINIPRFIALCGNCTRTEIDADEYKRTESGATADASGVAR